MYINNQVMVKIYCNQYIISLFFVSYNGVDTNYCSYRRYYCSTEMTSERR